MSIILTLMAIIITILILAQNFIYIIFSVFQTIVMTRRFEIDDTITRRYKRFNATGTQLIARLLPPSNDNEDPVSHFLASVDDLFNHALQNVSDSESGKSK